MPKLPGRLGELTARDIMAGAVIAVRETDSLQQAIETLRSEHITGAPVVDAAGKLVGILSLHDLIAPSAAGGERPSSVPLSHGPDRTSWELFDRAGSPAEEHAGQTVKDRMSTQVASVAAEATLVDAARLMCNGHWHRVPVVDRSGEIVGIISTMDVLAAVVNAADEADQRSR
jgi:CBS-domain-containing membrane protein